MSQQEKEENRSSSTDTRKNTLAQSKDSHSNNAEQKETLTTSVKLGITLETKDLPQRSVSSISGKDKDTGTGTNMLNTDQNGSTVPQLEEAVKLSDAAMDCKSSPDISQNNQLHPHTAEDSKPSNIAEDSKPSKTAESSKPSKTAESSKPLDTAERSKPLDNANSSDPSGTSDSSKPSGTTGSLEPSSTDKSSKSSDPADDSEEDDEGICLGDGSDLDSDGRNKMFERGLKFERDGKRNKALKCYMACLNGLKQDTRFPLLPQCLRNIADIFYQKEEYDKAVHFIQAEKVYYESALIDTNDIQLKLEEAQQKEGGLPPNVSSDTVRASEYEHLARLCLDRGQPQLALEYAGKATKLRQTVLGDTDPVTVESLDFFASVYAKVGAEQYEESLKKFTDKSEGDEATEGSPLNGSGDQKEPVSILRKRKNSEKEKRVHFDESQLPRNIQNEENCAKSVLWALLVICMVVLIILGIYLNCHMAGSHTCLRLKSDLHYYYMRLKFWYYQYQSGPNAKVM